MTYAKLRPLVSVLTCALMLVLLVLLVIKTVRGIPPAAEPPDWAVFVKDGGYSRQPPPALLIGGTAGIIGVLLLIITSAFTPESRVGELVDRALVGLAGAGLITFAVVISVLFAQVINYDGAPVPREILAHTYGLDVEVFPEKLEAAQTPITKNLALVKGATIRNGEYGVYWSVVPIGEGEGSDLPSVGEPVVVDVADLDVAF